MIRYLILGHFYLCLAMFAGSTYGETIKVATAANFIATAHTLAAEFARDTGHTAEIISGASGKLFAQITHGAPFHIFLSADETKPRELVRLGHALVDTNFTYAQGQLVLWSHNPELVKGGFPPAEQYRKLALANARLAPYGLAAQQTLKSLNLVEVTRHKWVQGENVSQTLQFAMSGSAELGLIAASQWLALNQHGSSWLIPPHLHAPIKQNAVLLNNADQSLAAQAFFNYLKSEAAAHIITNDGYLSACAAGTPVTLVREK